MAKKRLLTGLQPSGDLHIGNYFGALKPFLKTYENNESFLMVADYHALTSKKDSENLKQNILNIVRSYLAAGVDPKKAVIFKQSDVPEHTELAWIFNCLVTVPFLMQAHSYKDKVAKGLEANAGLFTYPMLMAADILLYDTGKPGDNILVPVGKDQQQHIEYAREVVTKFNNAYGYTFEGPLGFFFKDAQTVLGTDGQKMSKSYGNTIPLFGTKDEISKAVMSITTDSGQGDTYFLEYAQNNKEFPTLGIPGVFGAVNVYKIHSLFRNDVNELDNIYNSNKNNYKALKEMLIEDIENSIAPMRRKYENITESEVKKILKESAKKAQKVASAKMKEVRQKIGVAL